MLLILNKDLPFKRKQKGVVLVVALVMLLVMTGIGITLMSGSTLQERMAGNTRQLSLAQINAEGALRQAEAFLQGLNITSTPGTSPRTVIANSFHTTGDGRYVAVIENEYPEYVGNLDPLTADLYEAGTWLSINSVTAVATTAAATAPAYTIEYIGRIKHGYIDESEVQKDDDLKDSVSTSPFAFRITAIGYGANPNIFAVVQSVYSTGE